MEKYQKKQGIWRSFGQAFRGINYTWRTQGHLQFHVVAAIMVIIFGWLAGLNRWEWLFVFVAIGNVIIAEVFNTAIEIAVDLAQPNFHPLAGMAKDVAAGAVVISSIQAIIIGVVIFSSPLINFIRSLF